MSTFIRATPDRESQYALSVCLFVCLSVRPPVCLSIHVCLSVCVPPVCLSICRYMTREWVPKPNHTRRRSCFDEKILTQRVMAFLMEQIHFAQMNLTHTFASNIRFNTTTLSYKGSNTEIDFKRLNTTVWTGRTEWKYHANTSSRK